MVAPTFAHERVPSWVALAVWTLTIAACGGGASSTGGSSAPTSGATPDEPRPLVVRIEEVSDEFDELAGQEEELVKAQVEKRRRGEHGELPPLERNGAIEPETWPKVTVLNNTPHGLIVWFAGPCARTIALNARAEHTLELCEGTYDIAAELSAPDFLPFVGEGDELVLGYRYRLTFYVMVEPRTRRRAR